MLLYIIRHADPIYDPDSLTDLGHRQAEALSKRLSVNGIDKAFSSPNGRAQMTAKPTCDLLGLEYGIEDWMSEDLAGKDFSCEIDGVRGWVFTRQNTKMKYDEAINAGGKWHEARYFTYANSIEGYKRIAQCSDDFTEKLGYKREEYGYRAIRPNNDRVAAFCHFGFGLLWLSYLLDIPPHLFLSTFEITHSSVTILDFQNYEDGHTAPKCLCLSDTSHIYAAGLPMKYHGWLDI